MFVCSYLNKVLHTFNVLQCIRFVVFYICWIFDSKGCAIQHRLGKPLTANLSLKCYAATTHLKTWRIICFINNLDSILLKKRTGFILIIHIPWSSLALNLVNFPFNIPILISLQRYEWSTHVAFLCYYLSQYDLHLNLI